MGRLQILPARAMVTLRIWRTLWYILAIDRLLRYNLCVRNSCYRASGVDLLLLYHGCIFSRHCAIAHIFIVPNGTILRRRWRNTRLYDASAQYLYRKWWNLASNASHMKITL